MYKTYLISTFLSESVYIRGKFYQILVSPAVVNAHSLKSTMTHNTDAPYINTDDCSNSSEEDKLPIVTIYQNL